LSGEAGAWLELDLDFIGQVFRDRGDDAFEYVTIQLELFDETAAEFAGVLKADKDQEIRAAGRAKIIEAAVFGFAGNGRGDEAQALLGNDAIGGLLDEDTRARLIRDTAALSEAHDRDRSEREKRAVTEEVRKRNTAALAFATGFRPRMETGEATLADIATAETDGVLTAA